MTIENFIELFYIKAYLKNQDQAFMNLIEGSVQYSGIVSYRKSSYHGFVHGNNIAFFAAQVLEAGLTVEKISHHIETLYPTKHNGSIKAKEQYQNKTYKEALYEKVKDKFAEITLENMSDVLAQMLFSIVQDAAMDKESEKVAKPDRRRKPPLSDQVANTTECNAQALSVQIDSMLEGLIDTGRKISESQIVIGGIKIHPKPIPKLWTDLDRYFERLKDLTSSLHKLYSAQSPTIRELFRTVDCLKKDDFILSEGEYRIIIPGKERPVHKVMELLSKLKEETPGNINRNQDSTSLKE